MVLLLVQSFPVYTLIILSCRSVPSVRYLFVIINQTGIKLPVCYLIALKKNCLHKKKSNPLHTLPSNPKAKQERGRQHTILTSLLC